MTHETTIRILCDNLREFSERQSRAQKQQTLTVEMLCDHILSKGKGTDTQELYRQFLACIPAAQPIDQAIACLKIAAVHKAPPHDPLGLFDAEEGVAAGSHGRIALVRNRYNEQAFERFSPIILKAKPSYASSFAQACEDVADSRCEFCILPIENQENGRLFGFYAMMDRYELKICASCTLENDNARIRCALVGNSIPDRLPKGTDQRLEFSVTQPIGSFPSDILDLADALAAQTLCVDSIPVRYDDGLQRFFFTFRLTTQAAQAFHLYLSANHTAYTPIGFYTALP